LPAKIAYGRGNAKFICVLREPAATLRRAASARFEEYGPWKLNYSLKNIKFAGKFDKNYEY
jgi:hypothetical protein